MTMSMARTLGLIKAIEYALSYAFNNDFGFATLYAIGYALGQSLQHLGTLLSRIMRKDLDRRKTYGQRANKAAKRDNMSVFY